CGRGGWSSARQSRGSNRLVVARHAGIGGGAPTPLSNAERPVAVAFGSNLGDRREAILAAADEVSRILSEFQLSFLIETAPVGAGLEHDPPYLNAAGVGRSARSSRELLEALLDIEQRHGRTRPRTNAPRTLDLDLILAGD